MITPLVAVKLNEGVDISVILNRYGSLLTLRNQYGFVYYLYCNVLTSPEVLEIVTNISKMDEVEWCSPDRFLMSELHNTYYSDQYYLENTGQNGGTEGIDINVVPAWNITQGSSNITVAVVDLGVDIAHEDFGGRILEGYTAINSTGIGEPFNVTTVDKNEAHGTACAGIIAASNNNIGIRGVASNVKILPVNIGTNDNSGPAGFSYQSAGIIWACDHQADVISCSFGTPQSVDNLDLENAISYAFNYGRNGKGCLVVCSSGNSYPTHQNVGTPANIEGVIAVGAIKKDGSIWEYSQRGPRLDLVAPSGNVALQGTGLFTGDVVTTDLTGLAGYSSGNYTSAFGGTSAACPQVAGVAALMLSVDSTLTVSDVRAILQQTARDLGNPGKDNTFGYGLVDAYEAVRVAGATIVGPSNFGNTNSNEYSISYLTNGATVNWSISGTNSSSVCLQSNSPITNHCTVSINTYSFVSSFTLTAQIIKNGVVLKTISKQISRNYSFSGTYEQMSCSDYGFTTPAITPTTIPSNHTMTVYVGGIVTLTSNYFKLKDVTTSGPYGNFYYAGGNQIRFTLTPANVSQALVITIHEVGCDDEVQLTFYAYPIQNLNLNITPQGSQTYELSVTRNEVAEQSQEGISDIAERTQEDVSAEKNSSRLIDEPWTLEVTNAVSGRNALSRNMDEPVYLLNTAGWEPGVYIVRAIVGKESLTGKITVN